MALSFLLGDLRIWRIDHFAALVAGNPALQLDLRHHLFGFAAFFATAMASGVMQISQGMGQGISFLQFDLGDDAVDDLDLLEGALELAR